MKQPDFRQVAYDPQWIPPRGVSRRAFLTSGTMGVGMAALAHLLMQEKLLGKPELAGEPRRFDLKPKVPHHGPRARAMISLFMQGGPSHMDLFDPKPRLNELDGKDFPGQVKYDNAAQASSKVLGCPWKFLRYGRCGMEMSELLPHIGSMADEICLVRSMHTGVNNHGQGIDAMNTGHPLGGRPSLGSWLTYALGSQSQDLPAFVVLVDHGLPVLGPRNWSNGWLPSLYQGTVVRPAEPRILNLDPAPQFAGAPQERFLGFLDQLNRAHLQQRPGEDDLEARILSFELAARMQTAAKEAMDISSEPQPVREMYGLDVPEIRSFGERCLIARRLVERGVRFVQIYTATQMWDHHGAIRTLLPSACRHIDQPTAALIKDLKQRGLMETTLLHWGGEMGRLPVVQNDAGPDKVGRDHNTYGFSMFLAGAGIQGGLVHGATDEFGHYAIENKVTHHDYHATLLHLFGLDPAELTYRHAGREQSLLDGKPGRIVTEILA